MPCGRIDAIDPCSRAGDWSNVDGDYFGLSLADIAKALEP
jgi:hypothetical protein